MTFSSRIRYSSESTAIATVDNVGRITGVGAGKTAVIINGYRMPVTVKAAEPAESK